MIATVGSLIFAVLFWIVVIWLVLAVISWLLG